MVIWGVVLLVAQPVAGGCSQAADDEPVLCPARLPAVRSLVVEQRARQAWIEKTPPVSCRGFTPNVRTIKDYFLRAKRTDAASVHYTLPESPCYASGKVSFSDGRSARWRIDQFRIGKLKFIGGETILLYCPKCRSKPFIE